MTALRVENLRSKVKTVDDVPREEMAPADFTVSAGECVCISGPSGAGKTLLLRAIADLDPSEGRVYLGDQERNQFSGPEWRHKVGYLPAESAWWDDRIRSHFLGRRVKHLEKLGFELTILQRQVPRLSTGERQRLALLRLLNAAPQVLLLDEPTASLDPTNTKRVEALLTAYRQRHNVPVLWISHDPKQIRRVCDRHLRLRNGELEPAHLVRRKAAPKKAAKKKSAPKISVPKKRAPKKKITRKKKATGKKKAAGK